LPPPWQVVIVPELEAELGKKTMLHLHKRIASKLKALEQDPLQLGKPLSGPLAGCRRVRLGGTHRLVYVVRGDIVYVLAVASREGDKPYGDETVRRAGRVRDG
jgi:mRNA-degrading endonuclease RelE of RelBE toxin-antitoxin system